MQDQVRIQADRVSFTYEEAKTPALSHASLTVREGEFVAVLGHNGSGKSTLAKLLNALYLPSEGSILVCGHDTAKEEFVWEIRRRAGMIKNYSFICFTNCKNIKNTTNKCNY